MSTYGFENSAQSSSQPVALKVDQSVPITIPAGQNTVAKGQILARNVSTGKYIKLGTIAAVTAESVTPSPADVTSKYNMAFQLANNPVIPGTVVMSAVVAGALASITDDRKGNLFEASKKAFGNIDYATGLGGLTTVSAMASSTDSFTAAYSHFGNAGDLDIYDMVVNHCKAEDATSEIKISALKKGEVDSALLTPTITRTNRQQQLLFGDNGLILKRVDTLS